MSSRTRLRPIHAHAHAALAARTATGPVSGRTIEQTMIAFEQAMAEEPVSFEAVVRYVKCALRELERAQGPTEHAHALRIVSRCAKTIRAFQCSPEAARYLRSLLVEALLRTWPATLEADPDQAPDTEDAPFDYSRLLPRARNAASR